MSVSIIQFPKPHKKAYALSEPLNIQAFELLLFSGSVMSESLWAHGL